jgi:NAD(P)-dependent dehydrogenase (short-subunit alcohol dehydrogenase family)
MNNQEKFCFGAAVGAAAVLIGRQSLRSRNAIDFAGRTVVISGGSRGLGLVMARQLVDEGARVCLLARDGEELDRATQQIAERGAAMLDGVTMMTCDVRSHDSVKAAISTILTERGAIDVLINNAGVIQVGPLEHMTMADFENAMATHFWAPLHLIQECVPPMRGRGFGRIVNISSIGGRIAVPHLAPYSASKFALVGLSDAVRAELAQYGIRVTTVAPGLMRTGSPINAEVKGQHDAEFAWFTIADSIPGLSVSAETAARQIIDACRYGDPELTIGMPAKVAVIANALFPAVVARLMTLTTRMLPAPSDAQGDVNRKGHETDSPWAPSPLTTLTNRAAEQNNEV